MQKTFSLASILRPHSNMIYINTMKSEDVGPSEMRPSEEHVNATLAHKLEGRKASLARSTETASLHLTDTQNH